MATVAVGYSVVRSAQSTDVFSKGKGCTMTARERRIAGLWRNPERVLSVARREQDRGLGAGVDGNVSARLRKL